MQYLQGELKDINTQSKFNWPPSIPVYKRVKINDCRQNTYRDIIRYVRDETFEMPLLQEPNPNTGYLPNAVAIGPILRSQPVIVDYRSNNNQLRGMIKRVAHAVPSVWQTIPGFRRFVQEYVHSHFQPLPYIPISHEFLDEGWLNNSKHYTLKQKAKFHQLLQSFLELPSLDINSISKCTRSNIFACQSFIKREFYGELKEPRIINSRSDMFKALVAPYIKQIEETVCHNKHFIKHTTPQERAHRMQEIVDNYQFVVETDYSSFEGSFQEEIQQSVEWYLFSHLLYNNPIIKDVLRKVYFPANNTCIFGNSRRLIDSVTFRGSRMSGDMWTSLANGFTNQMLFMYTASRTEHKWFEKHSYDFLVEGDDGFFGYDFPVDWSIVGDLGFKLKIKQGQNINDLSFCGTRLGPNETPVPDFWRILEKFGWSFDDVNIMHYKNENTKTDDELLYAKSLSLLAESEGVPILQPLATKLLSLCRVHKLVHRCIGYYEEEILQLTEYTPTVRDITDQMRGFFYEFTGIEPKRQIMIESMIAEQTSPRFRLPLTRMLEPA